MACTAIIAGFFLVNGCIVKDSGSEAPPDQLFSMLREDFFIRYLLFNPTVSTYLGGDGYSSLLEDSNSRLRDFSKQGLDDELDYYETAQAVLAMISPDRLNMTNQVDYRLMRAQLSFLIREIGSLKLHEKAIEAYVLEAVNGIMFQLQQLEKLEGDLQGTETQWDRIIDRVKAVPQYLINAQANLVNGIQNGSIPDWRMIERDGLKGCDAAKSFLEGDLLDYGDKFMGDRDFAAEAMEELRQAAQAAAEAYTAFQNFLLSSYDTSGQVDRYAIGEEEYLYRITNNFGLTQSTAELYEYGAEQTALFEARIFERAEAISNKYSLGLDFSTYEKKLESTRQVMKYLQKDAPASDEELFALYRSITSAAVAYGREQELFDMPDEYEIDIVETPEVMRSSIWAAYVPAPPFKKGTVGQFLVTPTGDDPAQLAENSPSAITAVAVHEGFAGHDWHFKYMSNHADEISNIRWLPIGSIQDELAMWSDGIGAEAWAHYTEELFTEHPEGSEFGFYDDETVMSYLQQAVFRTARVRVDVGLHTGRMTYNEAVDYFCEHVYFYPNARLSADTDDEANAVYESADLEIYRYTKWPTQAITYNLGKKMVLDMREAYKNVMGDSYSERTFHESVMIQGTISPEFYQEAVLSQADEMED